MIFNIITQFGNKKFFRSVINILIFTFTFTTCACYSSYQSTVRPQSIENNVNIEIVKAIMKNGLVINLKGKDAVYLNNYKNGGDVISYSVTSYNDGTEPDQYNLPTVKSTYIQIRDIKALIVEKEEVNPGLTILLTLGIIAGLVLIAAIIVAATKESCPFVYSYDGAKYIFDGEPYGGAIAEGLKKTDYSRLENLKAVDGKYKLLMRNEADETQHTDEMKLLVIEHPLNTEVAPDITGKMTVFEKSQSPYSVTDENGNDITGFFAGRDYIQWQTDMPDNPVIDSKGLRHELTLKFPKPKDAKKVKLLINAGTAQWGGYMIKGMLEMRGDKVDQWYESINIKGTEYFKLYKFMEREELYFLKVNSLENNQWITRGMISASGPYIDEDRIIELNIENVSGDTLYIKFNPPCGYWKFDYAGVIYESTAPSNVTELSLNYARDEKDNDLKTSLSGIDGNYYSMPDSLSTANLEFEAPAQKENTNRSLYLKTTGYYDIHLKKDKPEQTELIKNIFNTPGLIVEISVNEYIKKIKSLGVNSK